MRFYTDKQTLQDLGFSATGGKPSLKQLFNQSRTRGGSVLLDELMETPLSDAVAIRERVNVIQYFLAREIPFPFQGPELDAASAYLDNTDERTRLQAQKEHHDAKLNRVLGMDTQVKLVMEGIAAVLNTFARARSFLASVDKEAPYFKEMMDDMQILFEEVDGMKLPAAQQKVPFDELVRFDNRYRFRKKAEVKKVFDHIYQLDAWMTIARVAREKGFVLPEVLDEQLSSAETVCVVLEGVYHPQIEHAKSNTLRMEDDQHIVFLTGANMAGKSTFMKSTGIAIYLAHLGFPVPAKAMRFTPFDGLVSSINLSDNLGMGYSHFLAEVKRIRMVAQRLAEGRRLFVLFDELFRGTNVKDAFEGTVELIKAFTKIKTSAFVISTHIIEAAEELREAKGIQYLFLPTRMEGTKPVYTYTLEKGVTSDRHGMLIIRNEGILDTLESADHHIAEPQATTFLSDEQTQKDLRLIGRYDPHAVFSLFNLTRTKGGENLLEKWFREPLIDVDKINERAALFRYFTENPLELLLDDADFEHFENYVSHRKPVGKVSAALSILTQKVAEQMVKDERYQETKRGIEATQRVLGVVRQYMVKQAAQEDNGIFVKHFAAAMDISHYLETKGILQPQKLTWSVMVDIDYQLSTKADDLLLLIQQLYQIDAMQAVGYVGRKKGFCYASALDRSASIIDIREGRHPKLDKGVGNDIYMQGGHNLIFLTGANMAGKSTFMKTASINLYLAHMGFPVAAQAMTFSVRDGIFTSINVDDSLSQGFSHYYAEVMRVKAIAEQVSQGKYLFVLFDELFKGTNVKDAFDATLAITKSFIRFKRTFFLISTHIVEVGEEIGREEATVAFLYMPTVMEGNKPTYPYKAEPGISADKHGMVIIRNERILELLND